MSDMIAHVYLDALHKAYVHRGGEECWEDFVSTVYKINGENFTKLTALFPQIPESLLAILNFVDGTYWCKYHDKTVAFFMFGSIPDEFSYSCYLTSSEEMLNSAKATAFLQEYINRDFAKEYDIPVDDKITDDFENLHWLHFADCMNNGGTSSLYLDFSPSKTGKVGQVVMFLHDPDELTVIADSFDEYLQKLITSDFAFIDEVDFNED